MTHRLPSSTFSLVLTVHYGKWISQKTTEINTIKCIEMCCQNKCTDTWARKRIPQGGFWLHDWKWWHHSWWHQSWWHLVALAVSLDGNGIKFCLGDNGNLSVEVDAEILNYYGVKWWHWLTTVNDGNHWMVTLYKLYLLSGHYDFWGLNTDLCHFVFSNLLILIFWEDQVDFIPNQGSAYDDKAFWVVTDLRLVS